MVAWWNPKAGKMSAREWTTKPGEEAGRKRRRPAECSGAYHQRVGIGKGESHHFLEIDLQNLWELAKHLIYFDKLVERASPS